MREYNRDNKFAGAGGEGDGKNPEEVALWYAVLDKKNLLSKLFRMQKQEGV